MVQQDGKYMGTNNFKQRQLVRIKEHIEAVVASIDNAQNKIIEKIVNEITKAIKNGNKVLTAGNGGSACDAQHMAGEFIGKFMHERTALPAICLCNDIASTYAIGNDYNFNLGLARALEGLAKKGDVLVAFSTSGNAKNLVCAAKYAKKNGIKVILISGRNGGELYKQKLYDIAYLVKGSNSTPRIQEIHEILMHTICEEVELNFKNIKSKIY